MSKECILVVEDEPPIQELICYNLKKERYRVESVASGKEALRLVRSKIPDLVLLDLMLPDINGLEVCKTIRAENAKVSIPIIMVTAKGEEADVVTGLELGADDYITKPFSPKVLTTRIRTVLRRQAMPPVDEDKPLEFENLVVHPGRREVLVKDQPVEFTFTEFGILRLLARKPGWVFTRGQIVDAIRGDDYAVTDRAVDFQIVGLRKKLGSYASYIKTVRGVGYKFDG